MQPVIALRLLRAIADRNDAVRAYVVAVQNCVLYHNGCRVPCVEVPQSVSSLIAAACRQFVARRFGEGR